MAWSSCVKLYTTVCMLNLNLWIYLGIRIGAFNFLGIFHLIGLCNLIYQCEGFISSSLCWKGGDIYSGVWAGWSW